MKYSIQMFLAKKKQTKKAKFFLCNILTICGRYIPAVSKTLKCTTQKTPPTLKQLYATL